jgi:Family of unknown function (DUF5681)
MIMKDRSRRTARSGSDERGATHGFDEAYTVGFGRPPLGSRFKRGISGNPKGRPKYSKNLKTLIHQALTAPIAVKEGAHSRRVSKLEGVVLRQLQGALKGNDRAALAIIKMAIQMGFLDDPVGGDSSEAPLSASDERILADLFTRGKKVRRR